MKHSDREIKRKGTTVRRCLAIMTAVMSFVSLAFPNYGILPRAGAADEEALLTAAGEDTGLLARFDFEDEPGGFLDLTAPDAYFPVDGSILKDLTEMTVEFKVKTDNTVPDPNWAFFAAPNEDEPVFEYEHYLGILLNNSNITVQRYANSGERPANDPNIVSAFDSDWHTVRVVFKAGSTFLCVDDEKTVEIGGAYSLADCIGECGVLWFGRAGWGAPGNNEGFNGFIDDIRIWDHAIFETVTDEQKYIVTDRVTDPKYTTVNMFDYWITAQTDNDYAALQAGIAQDGTATHNALLQGINSGHLFLFAGETAFGGGSLKQATAAEIGKWNRSTGDLGPNNELITTNEITQGIVQNTLDGDGYPVLALDGFDAPDNETLKDLWETDGKKTESLKYLFEAADGKYKTAYPDVTGLFRINENGYYEFRSWDTFAELNAEQTTAPKTSTANNHITLYKEKWGWGLPHEHDGQFFPFNDWSDMFYVKSDGNIAQINKNYNTVRYDNEKLENVNIAGGIGQTTVDEAPNHYFGMTVETEFRQPVDGTINRGTNKEPMIFDFSGDDDIWIFIDGVLVGDLGGIHGWKNITVDFSTGEVKISDDIYRNNVIQTKNLYDLFEAAQSKDKVGWKTVTDGSGTHTVFSDNSVHTLKFFYLERGNQYSNCNITFNLQEPVVDRIRKTDQNGNPLAGAVFELYAAEKSDIFDGGKQWHNADEFRKTGGAPMTVTVSGHDGSTALVKANGDALSYAADNYYILEETNIPEGFRKAPPVVLQYNGSTGTLKVVNKYETGAYAGFLAEWSSLGDVSFAEYNGGNYLKLGKVDDTALENGLAVAVPVIKSAAGWSPLYGSNTLGWNTVPPLNDTENGFITALAGAAFRQMADTDPRTQHWYLSWDGVQLGGYMENLPGDATRYVFNGGTEGDLVTLFLPKSALDTLLGVSYTNADERYAALSALLAGKDGQYLDGLAAKLIGLGIIYTGGTEFEKNNRTVIYVPNEQRELRVRKVNENGEAVQGAEFALFGSFEDAAEQTNAKSYGTTGTDGELVFSAGSGVGSGHMIWDSDTAVYWLKETAAPNGYGLNGNIIRVEVRSDGIYADATGIDPASGNGVSDDGISVEASLGGLTQTLVKYAEGIVDETLKYITVTEQTADGTGTWNDGAGEKLTYGADGYAPDVSFTADDGYIRVMPRQTAGSTGTGVHRDDLTGVELDGLFSLVNTVVVTDNTLPDASQVPPVTQNPSDSPDEQNEPDFSNEPDVSSEPVEPSEPNNSDDPSAPDSSDELNTSDNNPHTGFDARSVFWGAVLALSLAAAVYPQRKRGSNKK